MHRVMPGQRCRSKKCSIACTVHSAGMVKEDEGGVWKTDQVCRKGRMP